MYVNMNGELEYSEDDGYDDGELVQLSRVWEICGQCRGEGKSSAYLGAYSREEFFESFDSEERELYIQGGYDRPCEPCNGSGKVQVVDWERLEPTLAKLVRKAYNEYDAYNRTCEMERRYGA